MERRASVTAALVSAACFGTLAIFTSLAYKGGALPLQLLTWRFSMAAVLLGGFLALTKPQTLRIPLGDLGRYAVISLLGYGAASICFFFALTYTDAAVVAILLYTYPAMVVLAERLLFAVPLSSGRGVAVALTFVGCAFVSDPFSAQGGVVLIGVVLGLGAAACYSVFSMLSDRGLEGRPRATLMTYLFVYTALLSGVAALVTRTPLGTSEWTPIVWPMLLGIVALPTFAAILLYLRALRGLGAGQAAILSTFEPVFTIVLASLLLGERLSLTQWLGAALVLAGVFIAERAGRPAAELALV